MAFPPAGAGLVGDPQLPADLGDGLALTDPDIGRTQLVNNLLGRQPLFRPGR